MNFYANQKYYLINLSTRTVSITTHLRAENYSLAPGKCVYLGTLTDELVVKYHRYAALNISLRIVTQDKISYVINKSINATDELLNTEQERKAHMPMANSLTTKSIKQQEQEQVALEEQPQKQIEQDCQTEQKDNDIVDIKSRELELKQEDTNQEEDKLDGTPREIDVVEESAKIDLKNMTYNQLCDLAKARNIQYKGRISRNKLIELIAKDMK